jgi:streptomycin 3"-adenylyltransferase
MHHEAMTRELSFAGPIVAAEGASSHPQIVQTLALVSEVLGPDLVGAYLYGSSVLGGLRRYSDLDILVVARRPTTHDEKRRLALRLLVISRPDRLESRRPVELTIVVQEQVRPTRRLPVRGLDAPGIRKR